MQTIIPRQYHGRVIANDRLTPKIYYVRLELPEALTFTPGQYGSLLIDTFRRPMSFASLPSHIVEFIVDISPGGIASRYIAARTVGDTVTFLAPYGRFVISDAARPMVFIAAGSGIAPLRSQILDLLPGDTTAPVTLVFGNRDRANMFLVDEFNDLAKKYPRFTFIPTCSDPDPTWTGERGLVTDVVRRLVPTLAHSDTYVCGGPTMVAAALTMLHDLGMPAPQIHTEKFA